ncbi:MAG TPA: ABC transporter permease [Microbacteriaceae bacterium]|nr:ABC transporter permease [Microbacteriaceae bacterium]
MKFLDLLRSAIGNTFRSKLRTTLTVIAIFIGAFTLTITSAIGTGISNYIDTQVASIGSTNMLTVTKKADAPQAAGSGPAKYNPAQATDSSGFDRGPAASGAVLSKADLTKIARVKGITSVHPVVQISPKYIEYANHGKYQMTVNIAATFTKADLAAGSQLGDANTNEVLLPTSYLKNLGFGGAHSAVGKQVTIAIDDYQGVEHRVDATVVGVQNTTLLNGGVGLNQNLTDQLSEVQATGRPATLAPGYAVAMAHTAKNPTSTQIDAIKKTLSAEGYTGLTVADQIGAFQTVIGGIIGVLNAFAVIALIAAGFGIINTLLMSVQERTREIGLMKAMGMGGGKVYGLFSMEAVFIGFLGSAIGAAVGIGLGSLISNVLSDTVLSGLPGLHVMQFAPASIVTIILVVMAIAFLAGTLPARRAARQNPIDALRYE